MKVRRFYRPGAVCARPNESLREAARKMRRGGLSCLPVVDGERVVGIVTERDLVEAVARGAAPAGALVTDYMGDDGSVSVGLDDDSTAAELKMLAIGCRHLPVVDRERLVGMVSARDLYLMHARTHELEPSLAAATLNRDRGDWPDEAPPDVDSES
ncbi:MAG TPA: CBS domain-containing protein [Gemmatimonadales bacterium]|nr:CBS domain-containing protein [Gemmatimonadales bacterium]